ncbi:MotE family protein [Ferdinandcohnia sp. Marseille-Q9671]
METTEKEYSKFQWFLFVVLIPSLFTLVVVFVLLTVAGFNPVGTIKEFTNKLPVVSSLFNDEEDKQTQKTGEAEVSTVDLELEIQTKESEIADLKNQLDKKSGEIDSLQYEIDRLSEEIVQLQEEHLAKSKSLQELTQMYELMSPKNAAKIIPNLKENEAKEILTSIDTEKLAAIFEKMSPQDAARFTELITQ